MTRTNREVYLFFALLSLPVGPVPARHTIVARTEGRAARHLNTGPRLRAGPYCNHTMPCGLRKSLGQHLAKTIYILGADKRFYGYGIDVNPETASSLRLVLG